MHLFVSYSSHDEVAVKDIITDLEAAGHQVWYDRELAGGDSWWQEILAHIRGAAVFVLVLSPASLRSRPCRLERDYARALGLPLLPVQVGVVPNLRTSDVADSQIVDYERDSKAAAMGLIRAATQAAARHRPLPEPLPAPPPVPYEYLMRLGRTIGATEVAPYEQTAAVAQLREGLANEDEPSAREDLFALLDQLRARPDVTWSVVRQIDEIDAHHRPETSTDAQPPTAQVDGGRPTPSTRLLLVSLLTVALGGLVLVVGAATGSGILCTVGSAVLVGGLLWWLVVLARIR